MLTKRKRRRRRLEAEIEITCDMVKGGYGQLWRDGGIVNRRDNKIERWGESREDRW